MAKPYACKDRKPYWTKVEVQDGHTTVITPHQGKTRVPRVVEIPFRMEPECQFTHTQLGRLDERCAGCCHRATTPIDLNAS